MRDTFTLRSRNPKTPTRRYRMRRTPEGYAVHDGEGCEGEPFNGVLGCWHSKENSTVTSTQALTPYQGGGAVAERIAFTQEQVQVLKNTICRGASDAELQMFTYACQDTGLDPFLKQIWAIMRNVKVASNPDKYEKQLTIQIGIDGFRVMRDRIRDVNGVPLFEGMDGPQWSDDGKTWDDVPMTPRPKFARVAVYRRGVPRPFVAVVRGEAYDQDSPMWRRMYAEQEAKCAEALALRRAFPAEMSRLPAGDVAEYEPQLNAEQAAEVAAIAAKREQIEAPQVSDIATTEKTPSAPPSSPDGAVSRDTLGQIVRVMQDIDQSQGKARYQAAYEDACATFAEVAISPKKLGALSKLSQARGDEMLARLRVWQAGNDPRTPAAADPEPDEGEWRDADDAATAADENIVACVNCATPQQLEPDADPTTPCASCGKAIGIPEPDEQ